MIVEVLFLTGAIGLQLILVAAVPSPWAIIMPVPALFLASLGGLPIRKAIRLGRAILIVTVPVLLVRLITAYEFATVISWLDYAAGLLAAGWVAGGYLAFRKPSGVQLALTAIARGIPFRWAETAADMIRSALFLLPEVLRRMREGRDAARLRFARTGHTSTARRVLAVVRASFVSLSGVPQRRAEAMIVRGIVTPPGDTSPWP
jgi:hypothetical protein